MQNYLDRISAGAGLQMDECKALFDSVMTAQISETDLESLLVLLARKGETVDEIAGAAASLRRHMRPIRSQHADLLDTCGPGGVGSRIFNVSTTAAIVIAAAGMPVAKHGNRSVTSKSGSADVLKALGVNIEASVPQVERCLNELGIAFCFAPLLHPAMKHVAAVRRRLGFRTIFNLLGPLCNPAAAPRQLMGVGDASIRPRMAEALRRLGTRRSAVVRGCDGLGELTLSGPTEVTLIEGGDSREFVWSPADFGLRECKLNSLEVDHADQSARLVRGVLAGEPGPARDIVVLNAAAGLLVAERAATPREAADLAQAAIASRNAERLLAQLVELSHAPVNNSDQEN